MEGMIHNFEMRVIDQMQKVYPGARLWSYDVAEYNSGEPLLQTGD